MFMPEGRGKAVRIIESLGGELPKDSYVEPAKSIEV